MDTKELIQMASHIAGGIAGATIAHGTSLTPEVVAKIAQESLEIARAIEQAAEQAKKGKHGRLNISDEFLARSGRKLEDDL
jgi:hypothetical protein